jgi:signal transduction histidine kinase
MTPPTQEAADEVRRLQGCLNDLISMMALPALWKRSEPADIMGALLDGLVRMLELEFAEARVFQCPGAVPMDIVRPEGRAFGEASALATATLKLGMHGAFGVIVVGAARPGFPSAIERLLVQVGANQAAIGLHEARDRNEQRRTAQQLEQHVAERTEELTHLNAALRGEIAERRRAEEERLMLASLVEHSTDPKSGNPVAVATISRDITQRKRAEAELLRAREELAYVSRVTSMGELTASIAHEVNQPLAALVTNANACLHWLAAHPCNFAEAHAAAKRIIRDANRAAR